MRKQVDTLVRGAAERFRLRVVPAFVLQVNDERIGFDYVLLDRYGVLVLAAQPRAGREITGSERGPVWQGRADSEPKISIPNQLLLNQKRISSLKAALAVAGRRFPDEYFSDLVVFGGADTARLKLSASARMKVIDARELDTALQARLDFAYNPGAIEQQEIEDLISLLRVLDRADSSEGKPSETTRPTGLLARLLRRRPPTTVAVSDAALGIAPSAPRLSVDRYPPIDAPGRTKRAPMMGLLLLVAVALGLVWVMVSGGYRAVVEAAREQLTAIQTERSPVPATLPVSAGVELDRAKRVYRELAPSEYETTIDLDSPQVVNADDTTTYTWHFVPTEGEYAGVQRWIALSFDSAGQLRGVTGE